MDDLVNIDTRPYIRVPCGMIKFLHPFHYFCAAHSRFIDQREFFPEIMILFSIPGV